MKLIYSLWQVNENIKVKWQDHCPDREARGLRKTNQGTMSVSRAAEKDLMYIISPEGGESVRKVLSSVM